MSYTIGRIRTIGIAAQPTFGVAAPSATYVLPVNNAPALLPVVGKAMNQAALGSAYTINDIVNTVRSATFSPELNIDERHLPLLLKQRFAITSGTVSGETVAYQHTLAYSNTTRCWYTLFLQDDDLADYVMRDSLLSGTLTFDNDFVRANLTVVGAYPTETAVTNVVSQPNTFVGRMAQYKVADAGATVVSTTVLSLGLNMEMGLNSETTRHGLGSQDLAVLRLTSDKFSLNVAKLKGDTSVYDDNEAGQAKTAQIVVTDTGRYVSPTSTNPSIQIDVPRSKIETYSETAETEELVQENFTLTAIDTVGVNNTPISLTVVNSVSSY